MLSELNQNFSSFGLFPAEVVYNGELSAVAYIILAVAVFIIIGGLGWCFYRAMQSGGENAPIQHHDEVGDEQQASEK